MLSISPQYILGQPESGSTAGNPLAVHSAIPSCIRAGYIHTFRQPRFAHSGCNLILSQSERCAVADVDVLAEFQEFPEHRDGLAGGRAGSLPTPANGLTSANQAAVRYAGADRPAIYATARSSSRPGNLLKSAGLAVARLAALRMAVAAIMQSMKEPRRRPERLNNSAA